MNLTNNMYSLEEREKDEAFVKDLAAATGQPDLFEDIDPHLWRSVDEEVIKKMTYDYDDDDSDDSTGGVIFKVRNLEVKDSTTQHRLNLEVASEMIQQNKTSKARALVADTPDFRHDPDKLEREGLMWKETGLKKGDLSEEGMEFVSWKMVRGYPEMFVGKANGARTKDMFTLEGLHKNRIWDVYYLHQPKEIHPKPGLFVPTYQFQHLLDTINARLEINLTIPPGKNTSKFKLVFGEGNTPRPRFLGRTFTADGFKMFTGLVPRPKPEDDPSLGTEEGQAKLKSVLKMIANSHKKTEKSKKNAFKRFQDHRQWGRSLKRTQRYLGLRKKKSDGAAAESPVVRFVAIDLEAWEQNLDVITEVGIAILDTSDLKNSTPGKNGRNWFDAIKARHIHVAENRCFENYRYVQSCPENFDFGQTELIFGHDVPNIMRSIINNSPHPVVLVFHESKADIKFLKTINYNIYEAKNVIELVDTKYLHQYAIRSGNQPSVGTVCDYLEIHTKNLHNAGNDAVYTLQAMIGLAVKQREESLKRARGEGSQAAQIRQHHVPFAEMDEKEGWTSSGEDSDGGPPVRPAEFEMDWSPLPPRDDAAADGGW
ncbi:putative exonuclease [Triangularia verruculosa]|uniref:Exonuclease n=1 Tax=Triangularia verruculosa TaxID=2587418 RepID=A0AAN6XET1_9PEZI|nr:putative exonuclease [Triangularia verruculosa]